MSDIQSGKEANHGKNSLLYLLAMIIPRAIQIIVIPLYSFFIEPSELGIYTYTHTIYVFLDVFSLIGFNSYYLISYSSAKDKKSLNGTMFWSLILWNLLLTVILWVAMRVIWQAFGISVPFYPYVPLMLITHFFYTIEIIPMRTYRLCGQVRSYMLIVILRTVIMSVVGVFAVAVLKVGIIGRYVSDLVAYMVFAIVFIAYMGPNSYFRIDKGILKDALSFGTKLLPYNIVNSSKSMAHTSLTERLLSLAQLGIYSMATNITNILITISDSVSMAFEPEFYLRIGQPDYEDFLRRLKNLQLVIINWISIACGIFIREVLILFIDSRYWAAWDVVQIVAIANIITQVNIYVGQALIHKKTKLLFASSVSVFFVIIAIEWLLLKEIGLTAIGIATIASNLTNIGVLYFSWGRKVFSRMGHTRDFLIIVMGAVFVYGTRIFNGLQLVLCIAVKLAFFAIYTFILLRSYKINVSDVYHAVFKKKKG